jgi:Holliday junction resolvasome RuvABC DNA-binding subunit
LHRGTLAIARTASGQLAVRRRNEPSPYPGAKLDVSIVPMQARDALVGLGWKPAIAQAAVDEAWFHVGPDVAVELLIREALRRCPTKG